MRRKPILIALVIVLLFIGGFVGRIMWIAGVFRSIHPHFDGTCRLIEGPVGPEDLTIHPRTGVAYISASDRRALRAGHPVPGGIFAYELDAADATARNLTPQADISFQPHGLSLWTDESGGAVLFVINHPAPGSGPPSTVEIFDIVGDGLVHRASLTDPSLVMPNDLVAVGIDRFYLTNTHRYPPGMLQTVETYLQLRGANVLYYGPGGFRPALEGLVFPNGINVSPDGRTLYVAATTHRGVLVYDRDPATERLTKHDTIFLGSGADNIEVDAEGDLWIGAHPKLFAVGKHADDASRHAPSQVLRIRKPDSKDPRVEEVYLNDGAQISAASVAAVRGQRLLIGQIFGNGILDCTMQEHPKS